MPSEPDQPSRIRPKTTRFKKEAKVLGARVRALREERDWTLERAAERMDIDWKHLQKIESGTLNVTLSTLVRVASGFRCPLAALFTSEPPLPSAKRTKER